MVADLSNQKVHSKSIRFPQGKLVSIFKVINLDKLKFSGYLEVTFDPSEEVNPSNVWYLFFSKGKIVFSSREAISLFNILKSLQNYIPSFRNGHTEAYNNKINEIVFLAKEKVDISVLRLFSELTLKTRLVEYKDITQAIKKHILNDFDRYLFSNSGKIRLVFDKTIDNFRPIVGFDLEQILLIAKQRESEWQNIKKLIPSMSYYVRCNEQQFHWKSLPITQKQKIKQLINSGQTLEQIRYNLGEDSLKIAQTFAKLIKKELVIVSLEKKKVSLATQIYSGEKTTDVSSPEVVIIDDSLVLLKKFAAMVTNWGYRVRCCNDALIAVDFLLKSPPEIIFLDVNMPNLSGFQLMKKIRLQPQLNSIPLVVLTAEKTLMNQQRAKWSKSIFLTKPLSAEEIAYFESDLKALLQKMIPLK